MSFLALDASTWGDAQDIPASPLDHVHSPCVELVLPVPAVLLVLWRLTIITNPGGVPLQNLGVFRLTIGCSRGRHSDDVAVQPGTNGASINLPCQTLRASWVTGRVAGAELATLRIAVMAAPMTPPGMAWHGHQEWLATASQNPTITQAGMYQGHPLYDLDLPE